MSDIEYDYLSMSSITESGNINSLLYDNEIDELLNEFTYTEVDIHYNEATVPVIKYTVNEQEALYLIEEHNLDKFMDYLKINNPEVSVMEGINRLANHYNLLTENICVVLEDSIYRGRIEFLKRKLKKETNPKSKQNIKLELDNIKNKIKYFKDNKIKVLKKK